MAWYGKMKHDFDKLAFRNFQANKEKEYSAILSHDPKFCFESVRDYAETYMDMAEKHGKLGSDEKTLVKHHVHIQILHDSDIFSMLYDRFFSGDENNQKITQLSNITSCIDTLNDEETDIDEWFNKFERVAMANGWQDFEKGRKLPVWLKGKALNIWCELDDNMKYDYYEVKKKLSDKLDRSSNIKYLQEFFNKTQKVGESVDDYAMSLKKAFNKAFRGSNSVDAQRTLLGRFRTGLVPEIQSLMCTTEPEKIDDAIDLANKVENTLEMQMHKRSINNVQSSRNYENRDRHEYSDSTRSRKRSPTPFYNKRSSSPVNKNKFRSKSRSKSRDQVCYNCKKPGHFAKECRSKGTNKDFYRGSFQHKNNNNLNY